MLPIVSSGQEPPQRQGIAALDVSTVRLELDVLLANPPAGHGPQLQPNPWYERVFDLMPAANPDACTTDACTCDPAAGGVS